MYKMLYTIFQLIVYYKYLLQKETFYTRFFANIILKQDGIALRDVS